MSSTKAPIAATSAKPAAAAHARGRQNGFGSSDSCSRTSPDSAFAVDAPAVCSVPGGVLADEAQRVGRRFDDAKNLKPLKAYSLLNLSMSKPIAKGWDIVGRVDNLGNKDYETAGGYATGGRQFYVGMRWQGE